MARSSSRSRRISDEVQARGPLTVAAFMELALYDSEVGYYARASQRSGRAADFFTSVDVGPVFGELLAVQIAEMADILKPEVGSLRSEVGSLKPETDTSDFRLQTSDFNLVEAGAGNGRLSADILQTLKRHRPDVYDRTRLHLVEASALARDAQRATLGEAADRLSTSATQAPDSFEGVLLANELLDAMPVHQVVMRDDGLREVYVAASGRSARRSANGGGDGAPAHSLTTCEGPPSTPALAEYLDRLGIVLEPGWRAEINLRALDWVRDAARRLCRGFMILIDYGHDARELYSPSHSAGTLTTYARHTMAGPESGGAPPWLRHPGEQDMTAHVDFTSVRQAAEAEGLKTLGFLDQTYFVLGVLRGWESFFTAKDPRPLLQLKTLLMPGGLGSTHKVLIFGKGVGAPALRGCSFGVRVT